MEFCFYTFNKKKKHNTPPLRIPVAKTVLVPPGAMSASLLVRRDPKEPSHWAGGPTFAYPSPGSSSACTAVSSPIAGRRCAVGGCRQGPAAAR